MIRLLLVDDHPAMRAGLTAVLRSEPGIVPLGAIGSPGELEPALNRTAPDVVLLDYHLPETDGLVLCRTIKQRVPAPAVLIYSAYADAALTIPAMLAGADGLLHKGAPAGDLYNAIRTVARGDRLLSPVTREQFEAAGERLDPEDLPVLGMVLDGLAPADVAAATQMDTQALAARIDRMLARLRVDVPTPQA